MSEGFARQPTRSSLRLPTPCVVPTRIVPPTGWSARTWMGASAHAERRAVRLMTVSQLKRSAGPFPMAVGARLIAGCARVGPPARMGFVGEDAPRIVRANPAVTMAVAQRAESASRATSVLRVVPVSCVPGIVPVRVVAMMVAAEVVAIARQGFPVPMPLSAISVSPIVQARNVGTTGAVVAVAVALRNCSARRMASVCRA
jgi:hypothetical protein